MLRRILVKIKDKSVNLSQKAKEKILEYIEKKELGPGEKLPSELELQEMLGVSRYTIREALALLQQERFVNKVHGKGTFVNKNIIQIESGLEKLESISEIIKSLGYEYKVVYFNMQVTTPSKDMKAQLGLGADEKVITFKRIINSSDKFAVFCVDTVPERIIGNKSVLDIGNTSKFSMFNYLRKNYDIEIEYAVTEIIPTTPTADMIDKVNINKNNLFLLLKQIHYDKEGKPIIYSMDYFNSEIFRFKVNRLK